MELYLVNISDNGSNVSVAMEQVFSFYSFFIIILFLTPATIINIFLFASIVIERTIPGTLRLILVNIVLAGQLTIVGMLMVFMVPVVLSVRSDLQPSELACRFIAVTLTTGGAARLLFMATLTVTVYVIVKRGKKKLIFWRTIAAAIALWIFAISLCLSILSDEVVDVTFLTFSTCSYHGSGPWAYVGAFGYVILYGLTSFIITLIFSIITLLYLRKETVIDNGRGMKRVALFGLSLLVGNVFNSLGQSIPLIVGAFQPLGDRDYSEQDRTLSLVEGVLLLMSLIPTPILILVFFQKVRLRFFCVCLTLNDLCTGCIKGNKAKVPLAAEKSPLQSHGNKQAQNIDVNV